MASDSRINRVLPDRVDDRRGDYWHVGGDRHIACDEWTINDQRLIVNSKYNVTAAPSREGLSLRSTPPFDNPRRCNSFAWSGGVTLTLTLELL